MKKVSILALAAFALSSFSLHANDDENPVAQDNVAADDKKDESSNVTNSDATTEENGSIA